MVGSLSTKDIARFLTKASPVLRAKSVNNPDAAIAPRISLPRTYITSNASNVDHKRRNSDNFWKFIVVAGGVALSYRVWKLFMDKHESIREACLENEILEAKLREKKEELKNVKQDFHEAKSQENKKDFK